MPRYDFACRECGHQLEVSLKLAEHKDPLLLLCPKHGNTTFDQVLVSLPGIEDWGNCSEGRWFEHLGPHGKSFRDKKSYKEHLKREGLQEWAPRRGMPGQEV